MYKLSLCSLGFCCCFLEEEKVDLKYLENLYNYLEMYATIFMQFRVL